MKRFFITLAVIAMTVDITAYTPHECGGNRVTASGAHCQEGVTCALNGVPFGSKVIWQGQTYTVHDRCGYDNVLDIFVESRDRAFEIGRTRQVNIEVITPE